MKTSKLLLRTAILLQLQAASPVSIPLKTIWCGTDFAGFKENQSQILKEMFYLEKKGFVLPQSEEISVGEVRYGLTLKAMEYLEKRGF